MNQLNQQLINLFGGFRMPEMAGDQFEQVGKIKLAERFDEFTTKSKPIKFVMLGYPMKSPNHRDKVIGTLPDLGEEVSLKNFARFNEAIKQVYAPGVEISIVSDGLVFNDIMKVSDNTVAAYNEMAQDMAKDSPVKWFQLHDFYEKSNSLESMREKVITQFGIHEEELRRRILFDTDVNTLYKGMIRFMTADIAMYDFLSNSQLHKEAKKLATAMMFRNEAYSKLVQQEFKDSIRLSMHPSVNNGTKFSFQLIPSDMAWTSPWHCAILLDNGKFVTIHRKDAEKAGYSLQFKDGRAYNFTN